MRRNLTILLGSLALLSAPVAVAMMGNSDDLPDPPVPPPPDPDLVGREPHKDPVEPEPEPSVRPPSGGGDSGSGEAPVQQSILDPRCFTCLAAPVPKPTVADAKDGDAAKDGAAGQASSKPSTTPSPAAVPGPSALALLVPIGLGIVLLRRRA